MQYARLIIFVQCILFSSVIQSAEVKRGNHLPLPITGSALSRGQIFNLNSTFSVNRSTPANIKTTTSTVIFQEEFDGGAGFPPPGWKTVNADGGGTTGPWFQGNNSIFYSYSGEGYAAANYQGANDFYIDEWLISPQISSVSEFDTLQFWHRSPDFSAWDDSLEVRISTTDTAVASFTIRLGFFKSSTNGWLSMKYPLKNIVPNGSNIFIAFRYLLYNGGISGLSSDYIGLDLVQIIRPQVDKDIQALSIDYPFAKSKIIEGLAFTPLVSFRNAGLIDQENIPIRLKIIDPSGSVYEDADSITSLTTGETVQFEFKNYTPSVSGIYKVSAYSNISGDLNRSNDSTTSLFRGSVLISGTFTVGISGDITTLEKAFDTLNNNILSGDVTLSLISSLYTEPPLTLGPIDYASTPTRIDLNVREEQISTININSTSSQPYGIAIRGTSYVTINGSDISTNSRNISLNAVGKYGMVGVLVGGVDGAYADSNLIKNLNIRTGADSLSNSDGYYGVLLCGNNNYYPDGGNKIINCDISKHGAVGVGIQWQLGGFIKDNIIHDWVQISGENDVHGIWLGEGATSSTIEGNIIGNIQTNVNYFWAYGIENGVGEGSNVKIFNNMIYNILAKGAGTNVNFSRGIYSSNTLNSNDKYYFNSIYMSGYDSSASLESRSAGFEIFGGTDHLLLNNIIFNNISFNQTSADNKAYGIYLSALPDNLFSDYNDIYSPGTQGVIGYNNGNKVTLPDWINSFVYPVDTASISANPLFDSAAAGNLHINTNSISPVDGKGIPISGISTDIDGNTRSETVPDIGADEFLPGGVTIQSTYQPGWNLLSVPVVVEDFRKNSIFPNASSSAFAFVSGYVLADTLENRKGYWLKFSTSQEVGFAGAKVDSDTIDVNPGWNMIGSISDTVDVTEIIQIPTDNVISKFYKYNSTYFESSVLVPGRAYWVKVSNAGKIILTK
ncbi:MAG: choice-of-anchor J domain-containing protein [Ignavibacteriales bacterium]|nr:choice-of-anchor J domain-containing protein [Ignavibacteriales bacterium]